MAKKNLKSSYHHGDLRQTLLKVAAAIIRKEGIENLSLRKLAERAEVSRTAPYHHFKNKHELLCAIAEQGFRQYHRQSEIIFNDESTSPQEHFRASLQNYVKFARKNPELYELMYGRTIWKKKKATKELRVTASSFFNYNREMITSWQKAGVLDSKEDTLRLSQVIWGTMHGIAKLLIDGIYTHPSKTEEMCDCAATLFIKNPST